MSIKIMLVVGVVYLQKDRRTESRETKFERKVQESKEIQGEQDQTHLVEKDIVHLSQASSG